MKGKISKTSDPLDLDNWEFYVVPTKELDERFGELRKVTLKNLLLVSSAKSFDEIKKSIFYL